MKVVFLIGNAAVGKMTVGQALMKRTGLRLFHNHMTIEPVIEIFGSYQAETIGRLREVIFEAFAASDQYGMIFTYMWAFDHQSDWDYIAHVRDIFTRENSETQFYYVELVTTRDIRIARNTTENRLAHKASKRDLEESAQRLLRDDGRCRCESLPGELPFEHYLRIDNSDLTPEDAATQIAEHFAL